MSIGVQEFEGMPAVAVSQRRMLVEYQGEDGQTEESKP